MKIRVFEVTQKLRYYPVVGHRGGRRQQKHKADESGKGLNAFVHSYRRIRATRGGMRDVCTSGLVPGVPVTRIRTRFARVYVIMFAHTYILDYLEMKRLVSVRASGILSLVSKMKESTVGTTCLP